MTQPSPTPPIVAAAPLQRETSVANSVGHVHRLVLRRSLKAQNPRHGVYTCQHPCKERRELPRYISDAMPPGTRYSPLPTKSDEVLPYNWMTRTVR